MIFDTHAHYDDSAFDEDREELLLSMQENGVEAIVDVGASMDSSRMALELAEKYPFIYSALGVHPSETGELTEQDMDWLLRMAKQHSVKNGGKVVAIGEIGLDYFYLDKGDPDKEHQKKWFERQLVLAKEADLPIIIHSRDAAKDTLDILKNYPLEERGGIIHCYSYSKETAAEFLKMGYLFGIGGVVTFSNGKKLKETVEYLPMESILLETDCPYLSPVPHRGKRNSSLNLPYVVKAISEIKGIPEETVIELTKQNAMKLFMKH